MRNAKATIFWILTHTDFYFLGMGVCNARYQKCRHDKTGISCHRLSPIRTVLSVVLRKQMKPLRRRASALGYHMPLVGTTI